MSEPSQISPSEAAESPAYYPSRIAPFLRAPEDARTVFVVTAGAACAPLIAGAILFGWRAAVVAAISVFTCVAVEKLFYRISRVPALHGRSHAYLTGILLALTLPPFVPWYVPAIAGAFAILLGKAIFGGVGHFVWQPALVGRLAVAVMFPALMTPDAWPVLAQNRLLFGDIQAAKQVENYRQWRHRSAPLGADAFLVAPPTQILAGLTNSKEPPYSALAYARTDFTPTKPAVIMKLPPVNDLLYGARPGGIGETCAIVIVVAGLYLVYRHYVKWQLPLSFILSAAAVLAVAPVYLAGPNNTVEKMWFPLYSSDGFDVGFLYVSYQVLSGEILLAAFFLATEMTCRPVTTGGQVIFGVAGGTLAMLLQLYLSVPMPCYMAVLAMNTLTPKIDSLWRPRVLGTKRRWWKFA